MSDNFTFHIRLLVFYVFAMEEERCIICLDDLRSSRYLRLKCGHVFHDTCGETWYMTKVDAGCPLCRGNFQIDLISENDDTQVNISDSQWPRLHQMNEDRRRSEYGNLNIFETLMYFPRLV